MVGGCAGEGAGQAGGHKSTQPQHSAAAPAVHVCLFALHHLPLQAHHAINAVFVPSCHAMGFKGTVAGMPRCFAGASLKTAVAHLA